MTAYNEKDVIEVATALIDSAIYWDEGYVNAMCAHDGYACRHCGVGEFKKKGDVKHDTNCPVLISQDLLTRSEVARE